jgi:hypothetical protein
MQRIVAKLRDAFDKLGGAAAHNPLIRVVVLARRA